MFRIFETEKTRRCVCDAIASLMALNKFALCDIPFFWVLLVCTTRVRFDLGMTDLWYIEEECHEVDGALEKEKQCVALRIVKRKYLFHH